MNGRVAGAFGAKVWMRAAAAGCAALIAGAAMAADVRVPADSRLRGIMTKKAIRIAYRADDAPFSFVNDAKEQLGYSIDLCKQVTASIGHQIGVPDLKIEWVPVTVETRFTAVAGDKADMECGSSTVTLGRMKEVDFSNFIFVETTGVLVTRASNIHAFPDLAGRKIALVAGTTNERVVKEWVKAEKLDVTFVTVKDRDEATAALESGKVDAFASDKLLLAGAQVKHPEALAILPEDLSIEQYAIVLPRGDWAFRLAVNTGLADIFRSGRTAEVFERWFFGSRPGIMLTALYALGRIAE